MSRSKKMEQIKMFNIRTGEQTPPLQILDDYYEGKIEFNQLGWYILPQEYYDNSTDDYYYWFLFRVRKDGTGQRLSLKTGRWVELSLSYVHKGRYIRIDVTHNRHMKWHRICYCAFHGFIPNDFVVHHVDMVGSNNSIDNLVAMDKVSHDELHRLLKLKEKEL